MVENHFFNWDIKDMPYPDTYGVGIKIVHKEKDYITEGDYNKDGYRRARFSIRTYESVGIHYYGRFSFSSSIREVGTNMCVYIPGMEIPNECKSVSFDLNRPLEQWELDKYPYRFEPRYYKVGDLNNAFYYEEEVIRVFKEVIQEIFKGKWEIDCDYWTYQEKLLIDN